MKRTPRRKKLQVYTGRGIRGRHRMNIHVGKEAEHNMIRGRKW